MSLQVDFQYRSANLVFDPTPHSRRVIESESYQTVNQISVDRRLELIWTNGTVYLYFIYCVYSLFTLYISFPEIFFDFQLAEGNIAVVSFKIS